MTQAFQKIQTEDVENALMLLLESTRIDPIEASMQSATIAEVGTTTVTVRLDDGRLARIALWEFEPDMASGPLVVGAQTMVFADTSPDENVLIVSRFEAQRIDRWHHQIDDQLQGKDVVGSIVGRVNGGFTVELRGCIAFLPASQVDFHPVRDISPLIGVEQPFRILKVDLERGNIIVSRKAILEEDKSRKLAEVFRELEVGQIFEGVVKKIVSYGAFVSLGNVDGLLHLSEMAWHKVLDASQVVRVGECIRVQVLKVDKVNFRLNLSLKALLEDPWTNIEAKVLPGSVVRGRVTNIADYGAFVEIAAGVEGLLHISEISWKKRVAHPREIFSIGDEVDVIATDVDQKKRRISFSLKKLRPNPWEEFYAAHSPGTEIEGIVNGIEDSGISVSLGAEIEGKILVAKPTAENPAPCIFGDCQEGEILKVAVLEVDVEKQKISLEFVERMTRDDERNHGLMPAITIAEN